MPVVRIEPMTAADVEAILGLRPPRRPWAAGYPTDGDVEVAERLHSGAWSLPTKDDPFGPWQVIAADGSIVGGVGFHGPPGAEGEAEIGYGIVDSARGHGVATDAVRQLCAIAARHGVRRVVAATDPDNVASQRVLIRNGFTLLGPVEANATEETAELRWAVDLLPDSAA